MALAVVAVMIAKAINVNNHIEMTTYGEAISRARGCACA